MMQDYQQELIAIRDLLKKNPNGMSVTDISKALKKNKNTVGRYLDILLISGQVDMRTYGMAKVYSLSQRVPLSAMLSYSKDLIMVLDSESRIIDASANFLTLLQLSREETVGKNISYLQSPEVDVHELLTITTTDSPQSENMITFRIKGKEERIFHQKCVPTVFEDGRKGITLILEDITEHILAEREIRESEERFRMMAENIRDGLIIMENKKVVFANNRITEITGYPLDALMAKSPVSIIAPEYRKTIERRFTNMQPLPPGFHDDLVWIIRKDGERRCVYSRTTVMQNADTSYVFVIITDLTELKAKEAALNKSEQTFRMMAENIQDGLIIMENDKVVFTNRRIREISGYPEEDLMAMGLHETILAIDTSAIAASVAASGIVSPSERARIESIIRNVQTSPESSGEIKFWMRRKDGTPRFIHGKVTATRHGDIINTYITMSDLTDFAEREKTLRERIDALQEFLH